MGSALTPAQLTQLHRRRQVALREATRAEVRAAAALLRWDRLDESFPAFAALAGAVVAQNRRTSAGFALAYLRAHRVASGAGSPTGAAVVETVNRDRLNTALRVTALVSLKKAAAAGTAPEVALANAASRSSGAAARLVLDAGRETVTRTVEADPRARGWRRVLGGGGCDFCRERAGRRMTSAEVFEAHDSCGCTAEPVYR